MRLTIKRDRILKAYNGRVGCMCGCNGNYAYPTTITPAEIQAHQGWCPSDEDYNDNAVKLRIGRIENLINTGAATEVNITDQYIYVEYGNNRCFAVYFRETP